MPAPTTPRLFVGVDEIIALRHGANTVDAAYLGANQVWPVASGEAPLAALIASRSALSAALGVSRALAAEIASVSQAEAMLRVRRAYAALTGSISRIQAGLAATSPVEFAVLAQSVSSVVAALRVQRGVSATVQSRTALQAALRAQRALSAAAASRTGIEARILAERGLAAAVESVSAMAGALTVEASIAAYSFTLTAGEASGHQGYDTGVVFGTFGSIDAEPIEGHDLAFIFTGSIARAITFAGDALALLDGKTVFVDDVEYATGFSGWSVDGGSTGATWTAGNGPTFINTNEYFVEIK
jgi:hypothetical protein